MNTRNVMLTGVAILAGFATYAQNPAPQPGHHLGKLTPEQRAARKAERKAKFDAMTPAERKAFRETHRQQREAKLAAMAPEKRAQVTERKRLRKEQRKLNRG